jgi:hypothetical protein
LADAVPELPPELSDLVHAYAYDPWYERQLFVPIVDPPLTVQDDDEFWQVEPTPSAAAEALSSASSISTSEPVSQTKRGLSKFGGAPCLLPGEACSPRCNMCEQPMSLVVQFLLREMPELC